MSDLPPYRLPRYAVPEHYELLFEPNLTSATFRGEARVRLRIYEPVTELVLNAADLEITGARLGPAGGSLGALEVAYRPEEEQATLSAPQRVEPGEHILEMHFDGQLTDLLRGFYRSTFKADDGSEVVLAATQFESTDARRAFPCWDEPEFKATFGITIVADESLAVLSNAREISSGPAGPGKRRTRFADTVKMSTYLVAMAVGPFGMTEPRDVGGVPLRIGSVPGREALRNLAGDAAAHSLAFLSDYFSMPYPGDKLDHIAIPDFAAGAMENLGLVTYREPALLVSDDAAQVEKSRVVSTIAHETAHMWFGDLVTMKWWEGIWLNEAFATFMELLTADAFEPAWQVWTNFGVDRASALSTDSLRASRPIEYPVGRPEEAEDMFDVITYDKGASVLRMIERYLGYDTFRRGLNLYLDKHRFANTATTDLWDALEEASGQPVRATMGTWVNQAGHPLVSAELVEPGRLQLTQRKFLLDGGTDDPGQWVVPVTLRYAGTAGAEEHQQLLLDSPSTTVDIGGEPAWLLVNEGAWGVYRVGYSEQLRSKLYAALDRLDDRERLSLASDTWSGTVAGTVPLESSLKLWSLLRDDEDPDVWWAVAGGLGLLDLVCDEPQRAAVQALARSLAQGAFESSGWSPAGDETPRQARLRARLVTLLGTVGADAAVREEALGRLEAHGSGRTPLPADLATAVAQVVAAAGGESEWDLLYSLYKKARTPQDEVRFLHSLGGFSQAALLQRSIDLAFSGEVRLQDAPYLVMGILGHREGCALAWEAIEAHWDRMQDRWPPKVVPRVLTSLPALAAAGEDLAARAQRWLEDHPPAHGERQIAQSRERLGINLAFRARVRPGLAEALHRHAG